MEFEMKIISIHINFFFKTACLKLSKKLNTSDSENDKCLKLVPVYTVYSIENLLLTFNNIYVHLLYFIGHLDPVEFKELSVQVCYLKRITFLRFLL